LFELHDGAAIARRFRSPVDAEVLNGGFYVSRLESTAKDVDAGPTVVLVSVYPDEDGRLGNIGETVLAAALVPVHPPQVSGAVSRVPFSIGCNLERSRHYWLVLEGGWREPPPVMVFKKGLDVLSCLTASEDGLVRIMFTQQLDGGEPGDSRGLSFVADLELLERTPGEFPPP